MHKLIARKATINDLQTIVSLLLEDELGQTREKVGNKDNPIDQRYINAFKRINSDPNQYLMVIENSDQEIVATCQLTILPSLTYIGANRMQIEGVRVASHCRSQKIGEWMINAAIEWAKANGVSIVQLTTNKKRTRAKQFYERLGFEATHEGMKLLINANN